VFVLCWCSHSFSLCSGVVTGRWVCGASAVHVLLVQELTLFAKAAGTVFVFAFW
jgi:hypothetical protein